MEWKVTKHLCPFCGKRVLEFKDYYKCISPINNCFWVFKKTAIECYIPKKKGNLLCVLIMYKNQLKSIKWHINKKENQMSQAEKANSNRTTTRTAGEILSSLQENFDELNKAFADFRAEVRGTLFPFWPNNPGVSDSEIIDAINRCVELNDSLENKIIPVTNSQEKNIPKFLGELKEVFEALEIGTKEQSGQSILCKVAIRDIEKFLEELVESFKRSRS